MPPVKPRLIIFYRNPVYGAVKTRLAAAIGNHEALRIYLRLAEHTRQISLPLEVERVVYYSDSVVRDEWSDSFQQEVQRGTDLGARMHAAFDDAFHAGCTQVVIVGTDCFELTTGIIRDAFESLNDHQAVIGPALDGGYYLLGMTRPIAGIFENKNWGNATVFEETHADLVRANITYARLPVLRDVDEEKDLPPELL